MKSISSKLFQHICTIMKWSSFSDKLLYLLYYKVEAQWMDRFLVNLSLSLHVQSYGIYKCVRHKTLPSRSALCALLHDMWVQSHCQNWLQKSGPDAQCQTSKRKYLVLQIVKKKDSLSNMNMLLCCMMCEFKVIAKIDYRNRGQMHNAKLPKESIWYYKL